MRRFSYAAVAVTAGLGVACSESAEADRTTAEAGGDARDCGHCTGSCEAGRCLVRLAGVASPSNVAVTGDQAYFTACADGTGVVMSVGLSGIVPPLPLATGNTCATAAALDARSFYVAGLNPGEVTVIPLSGATANPIPAVPASTVGIAVDDANAYVTTVSGTLVALPLAGGAPSTLVSGERSMTSPAVDGTDVYFGAPVGGTVKKVPKGGGAATTLATVDTVRALALSGADVFLAAGYLVLSLSKSGGNPTTLGTAAGAEVVALGVDAESVYFASYGDVWKIPLRGGATVRLAGGQAGVTSIATDETSVYWTNAAPSSKEAGACCGSVVKLTPK